MPRTLIIGGTFNPVHVGHLRLATEAREALGFELIDWLPCYAPRHKEKAGLLPFPLRLELLRAAVGAAADTRINDIESRLPVPSFTCRTLEAMAAEEPDIERHFILGHDEFLRLHAWHRGREVIGLTHIVVAVRRDLDLGGFFDAVATAWPGCRPRPAPQGALAACELAPGRRAVLIAPPRLEISSSLVRERWLAGRNIDHLAPPAVIGLLAARRAEVAAAWTGDVEPARERQHP